MTGHRLTDRGGYIHWLSLVCPRASLTAELHTSSRLVHGRTFPYATPVLLLIETRNRYALLQGDLLASTYTHLTVKEL